MRCRLRAGSGMGIDFFDEDLFGGGADDLLANHAALEEEKGRNIVDAVFLGELLLLVDVDLDDLDLVGEFPGHFLEQRGDHFARAAPFGPKIDDDQFVGFKHFALEIESTYGRYMGTH